MTSTSQGARLVAAHPQLRIEPPELGGAKWNAMRLGDRKAVRVPSVAVAALCLAAEPTAYGTIAERLATTLTPAAVDAVLEGLLKCNLLLDVGEPEYEAALALDAEIRTWRSLGWSGAAEYHFQTYGYEFETYRPDGSSDEDARRMIRFGAREADTDRGKKASTEVVATLPAPAAEHVPGSIAEIAEIRNQTRRFDREALLRILSMVTLPIGSYRLPWPGAAPVWHKTSPSGGSRHPTEFVVKVVDVPGLAPGWYQVDTTTAELAWLREDDTELTTLFSGLVAHADFRPAAVLVYTCQFARNRYRYREPRTFRTIHMDAGALRGTAQLAAIASGFAAAHLDVIDSRAIADLLGFDPLIESPLTATILGPVREKGRL